MEKEKKKHADHFKRSAQLSHDSYEQWNEKSKAKMQQQVQELRDRKNKRFIGTCFYIYSVSIYYKIVFNTSENSSKLRIL